MRRLTNIADMLRCIWPIPKQQLIRRGYLIAKRKIDIATRNAASKPNVVDISPSSLPTLLSELRAPSGLVQRHSSGWTATFLGKSVPLGNIVQWEDATDSGEMQLWRMNLHYFEYLPQLDSSDAEILIDDWITSCRPYSPTAWKASWNAYTISLRIGAWINYFSNNDFASNDELKYLITASLVEQVEYLIKNLETDILGNHVIKNVRAITEASYFLSEHPESRKWIKTSNALLKIQLVKQIPNDGVHFEKSLSYHSQIFADLISIYVLVQDQALAKLLSVKLSAMSQALVDLCHPDGKIIQFADSGLDMAVHPALCLAVYEKVSSKTRSTSTHIAYQDAGYYGFRSDQIYIVVKMGELGPNELMAHAHADWGSLECSVYGKRIFVDQGVYEYIQGDKRQVSRSTYSHNTVVADKHEQANFIGSFRCAYRPSIESATHEPSDSGTRISGQIEIQTPSKMVCMSREINICNNVISILDQSPDASILESALLIHPDWKATETTTNSTLLLNVKDSNSVLVETPNGNLVIEDAVWWPNMGQSCMTQRLRISTTKGELSTFATIL